MIKPYTPDCQGSGDGHLAGIHCQGHPSSPRLWGKNFPVVRDQYLPQQKQPCMWKMGRILGFKPHRRHVYWGAFCRPRPPGEKE